jgi:hypothetical protein
LLEHATVHLLRFNESNLEERKKRERVLRHSLSFFAFPRLVVHGVYDSDMAPDASIRRPQAAAVSAAAAAESKDNHGKEDSSATSLRPTPASTLVAPFSLVSGFAKFTHKGEDTYSNSTGLRVDVPGKRR